ncbi:Leucine-rich repeat [Dillenia turbinata]|uniref:Leucine-rich repeat n=1 Tax=Dillenia turbinata TaxID=194707 RepID=A0AAN8UVT0_9MAGN
MQNNLFTGRIPSSMGYLSYLVSLHLEDNSLSGGLPSSLQNCSSLKTLVLSMNSFTGKLPPWIGSLGNLRFLSIRSNGFEEKVSTFVLFENRNQNDQKSTSQISLRAFSKPTGTGHLQTPILRNN